MCPSKLGRDALLLMVLCVRDLAMYWLLVECVAEGEMSFVASVL